MQDFPIIPATKKSLGKRRLIYGIGINDADYMVSADINGKRVICRLYDTWHGMMRRCFSNKLHNKRPTYKGCSVCDEWLTFSNFRSWMMAQDWNNKHLDKDIINPGNKIYSPKNCVFVSTHVNALLTDHRSARGDFLQGVSYCKTSKMFKSEISL